MQDFPGNSQAEKRIMNTENKGPEPAATSDQKQAKKVVSGKATVKKKPLGRRMKDLFLNDGGDYAEHLAQNVVVPMVKDMILSIATQLVDGVRMGVEEALFGPDESGRRRARTSAYGNNRPTVAYHNMSRSTTIRRSGDRPPVGRQPIRRSNEISQIILETREDCDAVLEELDALIDNIGHCTVGDYYTAMGETPRSTDEEWGWTDLSRARVHRLDREGREYYIEMPRPRPIES